MAADQGDHARAKRRSEQMGSTRQLQRSISPRERTAVVGCKGRSTSVADAILLSREREALTSSRSWLRADLARTGGEPLLFFCVWGRETVNGGSRPTTDGYCGKKMSNRPPGREESDEIRRVVETGV